jgi:cell division FtsZ-interacting protein ZapD
MHGSQQSGQTQVMIAVKMAYKDMIDPLDLQPVPSQLDLGGFPAVDEKKTVLHIKYLGRGVSG